MSFTSDRIRFRSGARLCALAAAIVAGAWSPAAAQTTDDGWHVTVAPYFMGAAMSGATTLHGHEVTIDASTSDIIENLQFGFMGMVMARKQNWGVGGDAIWMALGATVRDTNVDMNQGAFAVYGLRRLGAAADVTFGLRVNTLQGQLAFKQSGLVVNQDQTWVDPLAGVLLRTPADRRVQLKAYTEIGGFGAGSDFTWQFYPTLGIRLSKSSALEFGYRWLDIDYAKGEANDAFRYDVLAQGPVIGVTFHF